MDHNNEWNGVGGKTCKKFVDNKLIYNESFVRTKTLPIPIWVFVLEDTIRKVIS